MNFADLDTPALAADLDVLEQNIEVWRHTADKLAFRSVFTPKRTRSRKSLNCKSLPVPKASLVRS